MRAFGKSTPRGNPELGRVMRRYPDELPGPVSVEKEKEGDRYFMLDTNQFLCNVGQKFRHKGASHAKNPAIDNK